MKKNTFQAKLDSFKSDGENKFVEDKVEPKQALVTWNYLPDVISNIRGIRGDKSFFFWPVGSPWDYNNFVNRRLNNVVLKRMYILYILKSPASNDMTNWLHMKFWLIFRGFEGPNVVVGHKLLFVNVHTLSYSYYCLPSRPNPDVVHVS